MGTNGSLRGLASSNDNIVQCRMEIPTTNENGQTRPLLQEKENRAALALNPFFLSSELIPRFLRVP